jgi:hypothetical protein
VSGKGSIVGMATRYSVDGLGIESQWCEIFGGIQTSPQVHPDNLYSGYWLFTSGVKQPEHGAATYLLTEAGCE